MRVIMDFSLSESRAALDKVLLEMKKSLEFEIHNALAEYELQLKRETGDTYCIVDAELLVKRAVTDITQNIQNVLSTPLPVLVSHWDDAADVLDLIRDAFEKGGEHIQSMVLGNNAEVYMTLPMKDGKNLFEMVELHEVLSTTDSSSVEHILKTGMAKVRDICHKELMYIKEKLDKGVSW